MYLTENYSSIGYMTPSLGFVWSFRYKGEHPKESVLADQWLGLGRCLLETLVSALDLGQKRFGVSFC